MCCRVTCSSQWQCLAGFALLRGVALIARKLCELAARVFDLLSQNRSKGPQAIEGRIQLGTGHHWCLAATRPQYD